MFMKIKIAIYLLLLGFFGVTLGGVFKSLFEGGLGDLYRRQLGEFYGQAHSANFVTAIYLDYRLYDSFFEATVLFAVATGIIFMVRKDVEMLDPISLKALKIFDSKHDLED
ncbi:MAG: hypothetical protein AVO33_02950 [delta proteobacterium ML8_F1]|nr:MAG: hypothetical protein AVO33_02950 [delta proteobacterium ML8_F1]